MHSNFRILRLTAPLICKGTLTCRRSRRQENQYLVWPSFWSDKRQSVTIKYHKVRGDCWRSYTLKSKAQYFGDHLIEDFKHDGGSTELSPTFIDANLNELKTTLYVTHLRLHQPPHPAVPIHVPYPIFNQLNFRGCFLNWKEEAVPAQTDFLKMP